MFAISCCGVSLCSFATLVAIDDAVSFTHYTAISKKPYIE